MPDPKVAKHVPMRTCIGTNVKKPKSEMVRLVKLADGQVKIDVSGKERGRGANLDSDTNALEMAIKKKAIERALKLEYKLDNETLDRLRKEFAEALEYRKFRRGKKPITIRVSREQLESL